MVAGPFHLYYGYIQQEYLIHICVQRWVAYDTLSVQDIKDDLNKQSLMLLLKCLKIMENATFLSTENQVAFMYFGFLASQELVIE